MNWSLNAFSLIVLLFAGLAENSAQAGSFSPSPLPAMVNVQENLQRLIEDEDTDGDKKITVEDVQIHKHGRGDKRFWLRTTDGKDYEVVGAYYLANLLQELKLAQDTGATVAPVDLQRLFETLSNVSRGPFVTYTGTA